MTSTGCTYRPSVNLRILARTEHRQHEALRRFYMTVSALCNHNVATIERGADVVEAAARMRAEHVGDLIVVEQRGAKRVPVGILTDRDIVVAVVGKRVAASAVTVGEAMSAEPLTVNKDNGVEYALREMRRAGV